MSRPAKARSIKPVRQSVSVPVPIQPTRIPAIAEIATRAYEIYLERGGSHGADVEDWLQAERELTAAREVRFSTT
jgi:hypothetical protein